MDLNRSKTKEPFPGNGSIPLKLRQLFSEAGIEPNAERRIPWEDLPYALYDKGLYLSGLPASLLFAKDNPSPEEQLARLNVLLKWPFQGVENPLKLLQKACASESLVMLPRPLGRDVVFEIVKEDGSKMDIGRWKAPRPLTPRPKLSATASFTPVEKSRIVAPVDSPTVVATPGGAAHSSAANAKPMSPASPFTPAPKYAAISKAEKPRTKLSIPQKTSSTSVPQTAQPSLQLSRGQLQTEPFPESRNLPLRLREILKQAGALESKRFPGQISFKTLPEVLWSSGRYIAGIRASVIIGDMDPTIKQIREARGRSLRFNLPRAELAEMEKALEQGEIKLLPREKGRDVVFEVITDDGTIDISKWAGAPSESTNHSPLGEPHNLPTSQKASGRWKNAIEESSEAPITTPSVNTGKNSAVSLIEPFFRSKEVSLGFRRLFEKAGVVEDPGSPGFIPWSDIPHILWRSGLYITGLPYDLVLGSKSLDTVTREPWNPSSWQHYETPQLREGLQKGKVKLLPRPANRNVVFEVSGAGGKSLDVGQWHEAASPSPPIGNSPSEYEVQNEIQSGEQNESTGDNPPLRMWQEEVNNVMDQLADMLVNAGVQLVPHPTRENAYKITWSELPGLLHDAQVTLAGFPLNLLPYWKAQEKLNGKWVVTWKRDTLDHMVDLLDNEGVGVEKWDQEFKTIVQAVDVDTDDEYAFTYDDFVNAMSDDPERFAVDGRIMALVEPTNLGKRKRHLYNVNQEERAAKRQKMRREASSESPMVDIIELETDSDDEMAASPIPLASKEAALRKLAREDTPSVTSDGYLKPLHDHDLTVPELNAKYRRQKEIIRSIIAILIYHDIPCIAPEDEGLDFFLPWSNLPRHLAARMVYLAGWPSMCAPVVDNDAVVTQFGPASWEDAQWNALETALQNDSIDVKKPHHTKWLFELVDPNGKSVMSNVNFGRLWVQNNWGIEADQAVNIFAKDVSIMDPIVEETDDEQSDDEDMAVDL